MDRAFHDTLRLGIEKARLPVPVGALPLLEGFADRLLAWNRKVNLTRITAPAEVAEKHVVDSLLLLPFVERARTLLDVGSGAGLPGIPLAAALPRVSFTLLERSTRRAVFLQSCVVLLGLPNVRVVEADLGRALRVMHPELPRFDVVTFRAFAPLGRFFEDLERSSVEWRSIVAYKGKRGRAMEELAEMGERAAGARVEEVSVPFLDEERCLVVMRRAGAG